MLQSSGEGGWLLQGDAVVQIGSLPARVVYQIRTDQRWHTHRVAVDVLIGAVRQRLHIVHHARRGWRTRPENTPVSHIADCIDVDLGISPMTNTLAINRLALGVGESGETTAAWVRFPESTQEVLSIAPLAQRYTRLDEHRYRYQSGETYDALTYDTTIKVDDLGLVTYYEGGWKREAQSNL